MERVAILTAFFLASLALRTAWHRKRYGDLGALLDQAALNLPALPRAVKCRVYRVLPWRLPVLQTHAHDPMPLPVVLEAGNWAKSPERVLVSHGDLKGGRAETLLYRQEAACAWEEIRAYFKTHASLADK
jgi:hypothetical protein